MPQLPFLFVYFKLPYISFQNCFVFYIFQILIHCESFFLALFQHCESINIKHSANIPVPSDVNGWSHIKRAGEDKKHYSQFSSRLSCNVSRQQKLFINKSHQNQEARSLCKMKNMRFRVRYAVMLLNFPNVNSKRYPLF